MSDVNAKKSSRLLGRLVARELSDEEISSVGGGGGVNPMATTYRYTTISGTKEIDSADNGDQIP